VAPPRGGADRLFRPMAPVAAITAVRAGQASRHAHTAEKTARAARSFRIDVLPFATPTELRPAWREVSFCCPPGLGARVSTLAALEGDVQPFAMPVGRRCPPLAGSPRLSGPACFVPGRRRHKTPAGRNRFPCSRRHPETGAGYQSTIK
jgi:hypothetical protein